MEENKKVDRAPLDNKGEPYLMQVEPNMNRVNPPYLFLGMIAFLLLWLAWNFITYDDDVVREAYEKREAELTGITHGFEKITKDKSALGGNR
ncbi:MAG: hypothetical protein ACRBCK_04730 [Alphaproteobacteria bacterium]